jgi:hypothetical protein
MPSLLEMEESGSPLAARALIPDACLNVKVAEW